MRRIQPEIITGDNYESGRGVRSEEAVASCDLFDTSPIHINIFNISKINSEVRGDKAPRIKRLSEYIGESYFDYLAGLHDLVLLMDESHRYRASRWRESDQRTETDHRLGTHCYSSGRDWRQDLSRSRT